MKLRKEFLEFYSSIKIDEETQTLIEKRGILQTDIETNLPKILSEHEIELFKSDIRMIDQGSYKYNTTIKDKVVDRDVAVIIPLDIDKHTDPRQIKKYLRNSIDISSRTVAIKEPCVRASYIEDGEEWLHIDLPLYAKHNGNLYLARGKEFGNEYSWEIADPDGLNDYLYDELKNNDQKRRIVCLVKQWRNTVYENACTDHKIPSSIGLTLLSCKHFVRQVEFGEDNDLLALQQTLEVIKKEFLVTRDVNGDIVTAYIRCYLPVQPYSDVFKKMKESSSSYCIEFYKKLEIAVDNLTKAINADNDHDAGHYVRKVLGDEFPVPAKITVAGPVKNRERSFG